MPVLIIQLVGGRTFHVQNPDVERLRHLETQIRKMQAWEGAHLVAVHHPDDVASRVTFFAHQVIGLSLIEEGHEDPPAGS